MRTRRKYFAIVATLAALSCVLAGSAGARPQAAGPEATANDVMPQQVMAGQLVTITGSGLDSTQSVTFGKTVSTSVVVDPGGSWVRARVPAGVATGSTYVTLDLLGSPLSVGPITIQPGAVSPQANPKPRYTGAHASGSAVKVMRAPRVTAFSPRSGRPGSKVMITGANFGHSLWVKIGGFKTHHFTVSGSTTITAVVPARAHSGKIKVHSGAGTGVSVQAYKVVAK